LQRLPQANGVDDGKPANLLPVLDHVVHFALLDVTAPGAPPCSSRGGPNVTLRWIKGDRAKAVFRQ
jgi:hypothetical protein